MTQSDPRDPRGCAADAPLLAAWLEFQRDVEAGDVAPFSIPGHKHRRDLFGDIVRGDAPLFAGLDTMKQSRGLLAAAEGLAAEAWGVDWCRLSVGGSTHANQAAVLALGRPGQPVIVSRTLHRSVLLGIVFAGLRPVWVRPEIDAATGLPGAVPVAAVRAALAEHPDACGVLIGDPSYVGTLSDIAGLADAAHAAGVPLVVDAAWAAYFGFSPLVPAHALDRGADALVTSAHKTLPAWSQGALLLARTTRDGGLLDPDRLQRGFEASHTTSSAGAILASTDASRAMLQRDGEELVGRLVRLVTEARRRLSEVEGVTVLEGRPAGHPDGALAVDPAKLVVLIAGTGAHGHAVEDDLLADGITLEMADRDVLVPLLTVADDERSLSGLVVALAAAIGRHRGIPRPVTPSAAWSVESQPALTPREAFFATHETVDAEEAIGRVCAELIAPYPPGVPVLAPGEVVTAGALDALRETRRDGGRIAYAADPTLDTIQVVAGVPSTTPDA
ncbi:aminotransferase class I/II-fold pyridoxal phosphate-dependent enzyme [Microbacterium sp. NPDC056057]|uniref:aminotransferase class I/II-fold pyridoxal phosphate-dependent enzyme n=1 Tax=Microbacterium sp. NPDC056057 TaxID=3345699 RepID=UPI0035D5653E